MECSFEGCGSYAINHHLHGRNGSDSHLCDVCYWRSRASALSKALEVIASGGKDEFEWSLTKAEAIAQAAIAKAKGETK